MAAAAGAFGQPPLLVLGQGEAAQVDAMNEWARRVDASLGLMSGAFAICALMCALFAITGFDALRGRSALAARTLDLKCSIAFGSPAMRK